MKAAVVKIGTGNSFVTSGRAKGPAGEAFAIAKLAAYSNFTEVGVFASKKRDLKLPKTKVYSIVDDFEKIHDYDILLVVNGAPNFFGGAEDKALIYTYKAMNQFKGKKFYLLCDPVLVLKPIVPLMQSKEWAKNYNLEELEVDPNDFVWIHQCFELHISGIEKHAHFPFYFFPYLLYCDHKFKIQYRQVPLENKKFDVLYGGTFRYGKRVKNIVKYLFDYPDEFRVAMFGVNKNDKTLKKLSEKHKPPLIENPVPFNQFVDKMSESKFSIVFGDDLEVYRGNNFTQRIAECLIAGNVLFVDKSFDPEMKIFKTSEYYVETKEELYEKIKQLEKEWYEHVDYQRRTFYCDPAELCSKFYETISAFVEQNEVFKPKRIVDKSEIFLIKEYNPAKISRSDYEKIRNCVHNFIIVKEPNIKLIKFPGNVFTRKTQHLIDSFYRMYTDNGYHLCFTPPRGNLTETLKFVFVGIQPGSFLADFSKAESAWLIGPSSEVLHNLCMKLEIYPFFTNIYKNFYDKSNKNLNSVLKELEWFKEHFDPIFVFLGNYEEYSQIIDSIDITKAVKIWHPSFILRNPNKFNEWILLFKKKVQEVTR